MFFTCSQLLCALFSLKWVVVGTLPVLLWPRRVSCNDCQQCSRSSLCSLAHCSPMGPTLASAIDYQSDAILEYCVYSLQTEIVHLTNYGLLLPEPHFQLCTLTIYEKVVFVRHINYLRKVSKTHMWYSTFCICAKETNTTLNCFPWRVCKYYYCWFHCIAYQECCDRWGPLWLTGPLYLPFPYKLYVINLLKLPPLLQPKNRGY